MSLLRPFGLRAIRRTALSSPRRLLPPQTRGFSLSHSTLKALAHTTGTEPEPEPVARTAQGEVELDAVGKTAAAAQDKERKSEGARKVDEGKRSGRTMKSLRLEGKLCVITHPHTSIALTLAATFLEAGASHLVLLSTPTSRDTAKSSSTGFPSFSSTVTRPSPSPAEQLTTLAKQKGWTDAKIEEVMLEKDTPEEMEKTLKEVEEGRFGGKKVDVLCVGPPRDEEDAAATLPLITLFAQSMSCPPPASPYDPPASSRSIILLSTPYGPRVDLPQPQLLSHSPPEPTPQRKAGAAEMSRLAGVLGAKWASRGVRVNAISPGFLRTPEVESLLSHDPSLEDKWRQATPLGRVGGVEELKGAAVLLASDASRFTTGSNMIIDGGFSLV
ncbi:hypothetical protein JCM8547_004256 [Rhodosporidiobolus lusitaniae]